MKIKTTDIRKIEIFSPGTAGERAIRVETFTGTTEILDENSFVQIHFIKKKDVEVTIDISKHGEDYDAEGYVYFNGQNRQLLGETLGQCWREAIKILKNENLEFPKEEDFDPEYEFPDYSYVYWTNFEEND